MPTPLLAALNQPPAAVDDATKPERLPTRKIPASALARQLLIPGSNPGAASN